MSGMARSLSTSSMSSTTTVSSTSTRSSSSTKALSVPYSRRRVSPDQLVALIRLYNAKSHPSREDRVALAIEMNMELKTVTNWFQNKRQTEKKKSLVWRADGHRLSPATGPVAHQSSQLQSIVSLDRIAGLHEKPTGPITIPNALPQTPLTPRNTNRQVNTSLEYDQLWQHMPSSPLIPPSSPAADSARMSILPSRSKTMKSLEWACAKARAGRYEEGDEELGCIPEAESVEQSCEDMLTDDETDTESELDEVVTPDGSTNFSPGFVIPEDSTVPHGKKNTGTKLFAGHQQEDLDAAVALLGFMGRR